MISCLAGSLKLSPTPSKHHRASDSKPRRCVNVRAAASTINPNIKKEERQVVDTVLASSVETQVAYCRCWRSETFPLCNGAHVKFNKETGDNVGPLLLKKD